MSETGMIVRDEGQQSMLAALPQLGDVLVRCMPGIDTRAKATLLAWELAKSGLTPMEFQRRYHVLEDGRYSPRAEFIHAELMRAGWRVKWIDNGENGEQAVVEITKDSEVHRVAFTLEMAKAKRLVRAKSVWETDPALMLRARAITRAAAIVAPAIGAGLQDDADASGSTVVASEVVAEPTPAAEPKRRGRPPKKDEPSVSVEEATATANEAAEAGEQLKKAMTVDCESDGCEPAPAPELAEIRELCGKDKELQDVVGTAVREHWNRDSLSDLTSDEAKQVIVMILAMKLEMTPDAVANLCRNAIAWVRGLDAAKLLDDPKTTKITSLPPKASLALAEQMRGKLAAKN